jgi:antirestriction protein ArdC
MDDPPPPSWARQVRKGEKGNLVVHAGTFTPKDGETGEPVTTSEARKQPVNS